MSAIMKLNSGFTIPAVGLGVFQTPPDVTRATVYKALEIGYRHVDSAQFYDNEKETVGAITDFLASHPEVKREDIFYTTKLITFVFNGTEGATKGVASSIEIAKPLGYIDLMLVHVPKGKSQDRLDAYAALQEGVASGGIKSIGVSNFDIHHLKELLEWPGLKITPAVDQCELHPWLTRKKLVDYCTEKGIVMQAWGPLTRGIKLADPQLLELAKKYNKTPAQVLIRWSIEKGFITLPKSVHEERLVENFDVFDFKLAPEDVNALSHDDEHVLSVPSFDPCSWPLEN